MMKKKRKYTQQLNLHHHQHKKFLLERLTDIWEGDGVTGTVARGILALLLFTGALTIAAVAPNIVSAFGRRGRKKMHYDRSQFQKSFTYLKRHHYVDADIIQRGAEWKLTLTQKGETLLLKRILGELAIPPQEVWDGIWRIIIFDIPDTKKWAREGIRDRLNAMGFYRLQESVFVFPYPCKEELQFLTSLYRVRPYVRLIETTHITHDYDIKRYFSLEL